MEIEKISNESGVILELKGKLDTNTSPLLEDKITEILSELEAKSLELNLSALTYVTSAGLRVLLNTHKKIKSLNGNFFLTNVNQSIREIFEITGFAGILNIA